MGEPTGLTLLIMSSPFAAISLVCIVLALVLTVIGGALPPEVASLHNYFGLAGVAAYMGHLADTHLLRGAFKGSGAGQGRDDDEGASGDNASPSSTPADEADAAQEAPEASEPAPRAATRASAGTGSGTSTGGGKKAASSSTATSTGRSTSAKAPAASDTSPPGAQSQLQNQVAYQNMTAESSRMAYKLAGRCPLVINYGHMSNLSLADPPSSTRPSPSGPGTYGKSPYPGAGLDDPSAGMGPYGPLMGPGGGGMPAWMGGAPGGAPGMGPGKKAAGGEGAGGAGKEKVKEGRRRKVSDFDRVLATHASRCKQGASAGQGLVKAIRSAQEKGGEMQTEEVEGEEDEESFAWLEQLEGSKATSAHPEGGVGPSPPRLGSDFFRRQRGEGQKAEAKGGEQGKEAGEGEEKGKEEEGGTEAGVAGEGPGKEPGVKGKGLKKRAVASDTPAAADAHKEAEEGEEEGEEEVWADPVSDAASDAVSKPAVKPKAISKPQAVSKALPSKPLPSKAAPAKVVKPTRAHPPAATSSSDDEAAGPTEASAAEEEEGEEEEEEPVAYHTDLDYLQDQFRALSLLLKKNEVLVQMRERLLLGKSETDPNDPLAHGGMSPYYPPSMAMMSVNRKKHTQRALALASGAHPSTLPPPDEVPGGAESLHSAVRRRVEEAEEELDAMQAKIRARLVQTFSSRGGWIPRLEILCKTLALRSFEKHVLILLLREYLTSRYLGCSSAGLGGEGADRTYRSMLPARGGSTRRFDLKTLCAYFSVTFDEQLSAANRFFGKDAPLVHNGIVTFLNARLGYEEMVMGGAGSNALDAVVTADEKLCDFLLGLDDAPASRVPVRGGGASVYSPSVTLDDVILPKATRTKVEEALHGLKGYWELQQRQRGGGPTTSPLNSGPIGTTLNKGPITKNGPIVASAPPSSGDVRRPTGSTVFLLAGRQGVGKSSLADGMASWLGKRVLRVDDAMDLANTALQATIHDAIVVVEDLKGLKEEDGQASSLLSFMTSGRQHKSKVKDAIRELDTSNNLFIFQTEALDSVPACIARRLALVVELPSPDMALRRSIWQHLCPPHVSLSEDVDMDELALKWVLPGARIKEAWTTAQVSAILRGEEGYRVTQSDLMHAAQRQLHGKLQLANLAEKTTPLRGLDSAVLPVAVKKDLQTMIDYARISDVLFGEWGFDLHHGTTRGLSALFYGPPGTGKTLAAEILAYELGKPIKKVNLAETISMWVGETEKQLETLLREAKEADVVLFLDEAEALLRKRSEQSASYENRWSNLLLQRIETYEGVLVAATNLCDVIDEAYQRRFKFWISFPKPGADDRGGIWRTLVPPQAPLAADVDFKLLGQRYELTGGEIKSAVFRAAMRAAARARKDAAQPQEISMKDLQEAAEEEEKKKNEGTKYPFMYT